MSLELIKTALQTAEARALNRRMSLDAWAEDQRLRGERVELYRRYADGDHRAEMTPEMAKMLRINGSESRFNDNYMDVVIQTEADRLTVQALETDTDAAGEWVALLLDANRFDGFQGDTHEAALRDGDTYVMASWDNEARRVVWTHEPAWDGRSGVLVIAAPDNTIQAALKVWQETTASIGDTTRINVYYADRVEKYMSRDGGTLQRFEVEGEAWPAPLLWNGDPVGVPIVHFPNRGKTYDFYGQSEIENAIPLQDALNRTLYSMVMTAELTGFGVRWTKGFAWPGAMMPGQVIEIAKTGLNRDEVAEIGMLEQGEIAPYIQQAQWLTSEIGKITRTPAPEFMGADSSSGEAIKQREIGLLGKVRRFQVKAGNRWEDLVRLSWRLEAAFRSPPPAFERVNARWNDAQIRNDTELVTNAKLLVDMGLIEEGLRQMAPVFDWTEDKVQELVAAYQQQQLNNMNTLLGNLNVPTFDSAFGGIATGAA